jgi:hypothetical protein
VARKYGSTRYDVRVNRQGIVFQKTSASGPNGGERDLRPLIRTNIGPTTMVLIVEFLRRRER